MHKFILIIYSCFIFAVNATETKTLSVGWELWYPYQYHNKDDQLTGMDIEIFNAIAKQAQWPFTYVELPWKRHLEYLESGVVSIAFGASPSEDREQYAYFSKPYRDEIVNLFVRKGKSAKMVLKQLSDLIDLTYLIGIENGYYYGETFKYLYEDPEFKVKIKSVIDLEQNAKMLLNNQIDGFLVDPITMKFFIEKYKLHGEFEQHPLAIYESSIHIMLSKKLNTKRELTVINNAITALEQNGKLQALKAKWSTIGAQQ